MDDVFLALSAALTGYSVAELQGTGIAEDIAEKMFLQKGTALCEQLSHLWQETEDPEAILHDPQVGPMARELIAAWYTGQWGNSLYATNDTISSQAYIQALVWKAVQAHPMGAKQQGFGTWAYAPDYLEGLGK